MNVFEDVTELPMLEYWQTAVGFKQNRPATPLQNSRRP